MSKAVYPGSFNPAHLGHMHVILQASRLFDEVRVLIAVNPDKTYRVSAEDRRAILENLVGTLPCHNVAVDISNRPLMEYYDMMDRGTACRPYVRTQARTISRSTASAGGRPRRRSALPCSGTTS